MSLLQDSLSERSTQGMNQSRSSIQDNSGEVQALQEKLSLFDYLSPPHIAGVYRLQATNKML